MDKTRGTNLQLESEYCPPIDSSLFSAIVSDYDISDSVAVNELRDILDVLKASALAEEAAGFDPSGTSGAHDNENESSHQSSRSWHGDIASESTEDTEVSAMTSMLEAEKFSVSRAAYEANPDKERHDAGLEELSVVEKSKTLKEMFPNVKDFDIHFTLRKAGNNFGRAVEGLLNQAFLEEEGLQNGGYHTPKGVDAFTEPAISGRERRGRKKQRQLLRRTSSTPASRTDDSSDSPAPSSRWDRAKEDVDFIIQRTYLSPKTVSSVYHRNGASLAATIRALCDCSDSDLDPNPYLSMASPSVLQTHVAELCRDFQRLPYSHALALVQLTHPSTASAHELARALVSQSASASNSKIIPQYLPRSHSPVTNSSTPSADPILLSQHSATALATARSNAFTQAQSAYRKSKSKPLMGGAASYYSSVGRDASASLRRHEAAAADALVSTQSRPGEVDLHGTTVRDAVDIARARVEGWWASKGQEWARQGKVMGDGLRIITGAGKHSAGGRGRLGPAVGGMLVREGWKVEVGDGSIDVVGRVRR